MVRRKTKMRKSLAILLATVGLLGLVIFLVVAGFLGLSDRSSSSPTASSSPVDQSRSSTAASSPVNQSVSPSASSSSACSVNNADDIEYLIFWPGLPGATGNSLGVEDFATKLGTTGDGANRQLGFGNDIPVWGRNDSHIVQAIKQNFDTARRTNVAVIF
jgi:hypothetical protein